MAHPDSFSSHKSILVLGDDSKLNRTMAMLLSQTPRLKARVFKINNQHSTDSWDLILLLFSLPSSEAIVSLARANLLTQIGQTPLLIVSDHKFRSDAKQGIFHLSFPFGLEQLRSRVYELLGLEYLLAEKETAERVIPVAT